MRISVDLQWMLLVVWLLDHVTKCVSVYTDPDRNSNRRSHGNDGGGPSQPLPFYTEPNPNTYEQETDPESVLEPPVQGRINEETPFDTTYNPDDLQMGCTELRSKRYISDGFCTSVRPITEVVCAGECLPIQYLPHYATYQKTWSREKTREWRCVDDVIRYRNVNLLCQNGERRSYRIPTVRSCKCKRYDRRHNESDIPLNDRRQSIVRPEPQFDDRRSERRASKRRNRNQ